MAMSDEEIFYELVALIKEDIPDFDIRYKNQEWTSKVLGALSWIFNRNYMKTYTTTRYPKVYFPSHEFVENNWRRAWKILAHEYVHLWDRKQYGMVFNIGYASPQMWAVLALSALSAIWVGPWGLLGLIPLLCLLPLPSPGRRNAELRGYLMSMAVNYWRYGNVRESTKEWIVSQFTGSGYYFMWPFGKDMLARVDVALDDLKDDAVLYDGKKVASMKWKHSETFPKVHALLKDVDWATAV